MLLVCVGQGRVRFYFLYFHCHAISYMPLVWVFLPLLAQLCLAAWWLLPSPKLSNVHQPLPLYMENFTISSRYSGTDSTDPIPSLN